MKGQAGLLGQQIHRMRFQFCQVGHYKDFFTFSILDTGQWNGPNKTLKWLLSIKQQVRKGWEWQGVAWTHHLYLLIVLKETLASLSGL